MANTGLLKHGHPSLRIFLAQVRTKVTYNVQRPRQPHYRRHVMFEVTKPIYPKDPRSQVEKCEDYFLKVKSYNQEELHPYHKLLANMVTDDFSKHKTVAIYQRNPIDGYDFMLARAMFIKNKLVLHNFENKVIDAALRGTKYEQLLCLFHTECVMAFGDDPFHAVPLFLKLEKKIPEFVLLGGVVENRILAKNQLQAFSQLPGLDGARGQLAGLIGYHASNLASTLQKKQCNLSRSLEQYLKQEKES